ncbi:MAG: hypothetical protein GY869_25895, partial [Planctomycetes bacterium]|nr:hypothetical protein [Planctomycetota bacterium]
NYYQLLIIMNEIKEKIEKSFNSADINKNHEISPYIILNSNNNQNGVNNNINNQKFDNELNLNFRVITDNSIKIINHDNELLTSKNSDIIANINGEPVKQIISKDSILHYIQLNSDNLNDIIYIQPSPRPSPFKREREWALH